VEPPRAATRRSRLSPERAGELYEAVLGLLREVGFESMTLDAVAARVHMSKATLYRQWGGKVNLVVAAMRHAKWPPVTTEVDTGSLRGDLHALADLIAGGAVPDTALISGMAHAVLNDTELGVALREGVIGPQRAVIEHIIDRARDRGEIRPGTPAAGFVPHLVFGALPARRMLDGFFADADYLKNYFDAVILPALLGGRQDTSPTENHP
jgi:AcrR family transcriptional regulator